jgi:hypothetical protein
MEPNKMDTLFKEKLRSREIKPSDAAWDRLDAMLTVAEKPKRKLGWIYIAASVTGFLLLGTFFFNQKEDLVLEKQNKVVIQNPVLSKKTKSPTVIQMKKESELALKEEKRSTLKTNKIQVIKQQSISINNNQNQVAEVSIINQKTEQKSNSFQTDTVSVDELLASVEPSKSEKEQSQKPHVQVNASTLLSQVDGELDLSFREKVISKVNKNYQTVKVALANRNNQ